MPEQNKQLSLEERTTISFPHTIIPREVGALLDYVSKELKCDVRYQEEVNHSIQASRENSPQVHSQEVVKIEGQMIITHLELILLSFNLIRNITDRGSRYSGLKFFMIPGYDLDEINPSELNLMDYVRQSIDAYFNGNKLG